MMCILYEDLTNSVVSFNWDEGGADEVLGSQVCEFTDTNLGVKGEIWYITSQRGSALSKTLRTTMSSTLSGTKHYFVAFRLKSSLDYFTIPLEFGVVTEQGSGILGGAVSEANNISGLALAATNETVATNHSPASGWGSNVDADLLFDGGTYGNIINKWYLIADLENWGWSAMTVGGGSAAYALFGESATLGGGGGGGGARKKKKIASIMCAA